MQNVLTFVHDSHTSDLQDIATAIFCGAIEGDAGSQVFAEIEAHHQQYPQIRKYILDFADLTILDSKAISLLIVLHQKLKNKGIMVVIAEADVEICNLFDTIGLSRIIEMYKHSKEAKIVMNSESAC